MTTDRLLKRLFLVTAVFGALIVALSFYLVASSVFGWSAVAGLGLAAVNFWLLHRVVSDLVAGRRQGSMTVIYFVKLGGLFGVLFSLIYFAGLDPVGLAAGFSALVLAIVYVGITTPSEAASEGAGSTGGMESLDG